MWGMAGRAPPGSPVERWQIKQMQLLAFGALSPPKQAQHKGPTVQIEIPSIQINP